MAITKEDELAKAVENDEDRIVIEGDLKNQVIKIKATGKVAYVVAIGAVAVAVTAITLSNKKSASTSARHMEATVASVIAAGGAISAAAVWGIPTTKAAISMAVTARSSSVLTKLIDNYDIVEKSSKVIVLKRK